MCSFDVCSLFKNVPTRRNNTDLSWKTAFSTRSSTLPRASLHKLLEFVNKKSHFLFDDQYYDQIDGVTMGSLLGPVLANIFICHFEERWVTKGQIRPSLWYRYVDDTFTMFESKDTANTPTPQTADARQKTGTQPRKRGAPGQTTPAQQATRENLCAPTEF